MLTVSCSLGEAFIASFNGPGRRFLKRYQEMIVDYFNSKAFRDKVLLLLYMEVGTGKTLTSLACGIEGLKSGMFKRIIILSPKAVQDEFERNLQMYYNISKQPGYEKTREKIIMIPYNAGNAQTQFRRLGNLEDSLFIIDEAHLFMKSVIKAAIEDKTKKVNKKKTKTAKSLSDYISEAVIRIDTEDSIENTVKRKHKTSRLTGADKESSKGKNIGNAKQIYDMIDRLKHKKVICLTGTPASKHPFETVPMFNLAGCDFPMDYEKFIDQYINVNQHTIKNRQQLINKIKGMVAFVSGDAKAQNLKATPLEQVNVEMSEPQYKQYLIDYEKELNEKGFTNTVNVFGLPFGAKSSFHAKTFEDCVYWNDKLTNKPEDKNRYPGTINADRIHTPKCWKMYEDSQKYNGSCVFYFKFVKMYGTDCMEAVLQQNGYRLTKSSEDVFEKKDKRYVLFTGNIPYKTRLKWKQMFNDKRNMKGEYIKYLLLSPSGAVGVTLRNVRFLGIGSVEFNYSTVRQILGRVNRLNSHINLPEADRKLDNKIYIMTKNMNVYNKDKKRIDKLCNRIAPGYPEKCPTIERCIYQDSLLDDEVCEAFRECLREASIQTT